VSRRAHSVHAYWMWTDGEAGKYGCTLRHMRHEARGVPTLPKQNKTKQNKRTQNKTKRSDHVSELFVGRGVTHNTIGPLCHSIGCFSIYCRNLEKN